MKVHYPTTGRTGTRRDGLSAVQVKILGWVGDGFSTKEIAMKIRRSQKTVEYHRDRIVEMLKPRSPAELVKMAIGFGLTTLCLVLCAWPVRAGTAADVVNKTWSVWFDYPTNYVAKSAAAVQGQTNASAIAQATNLIYRIYTAPALAGTNTAWALSATTNNPPATSDGSRIAFTIPTQPLQVQFFKASVSNVFGEFFFINPGYVGLVPPDASASYGLQAAP